MKNKKGVLSLIFISCAVFFLALTYLYGYVPAIACIGYSIAALVLSKKKSTKLEKVVHYISIPMGIISIISLIVYSIVLVVLLMTATLTIIVSIVVEIIISVVSFILAVLMSLAEVIALFGPALLPLAEIIVIIATALAGLFVSFGEVLNSVIVILEKGIELFDSFEAMQVFISSIIDVIKSIIGIITELGEINHVL